MIASIAWIVNLTYNLSIDRRARVQNFSVSGPDSSCPDDDYRQGLAGFRPGGGADTRFLVLKLAIKHLLWPALIVGIILN